ncbi:hypothetical protein Q1695_003581 [Nippostrongylus brasiliensis]|nr:hypothetical protein Q1695_003581 [Nippostrongylus brasiliensis]
MIKQCFQTLCKEWMSECHWFCDSVKDQKETPVLNSATAVENRHPTLSARIQEWKTSR